MKIASLETGIVLLPADEPLAGARRTRTANARSSTLQAPTDAGVEGLGVTYFGGALTRTLAHAIDELGALIDRRRPAARRGGAPETAKRRGRLGRAGRHLHLALSAIDIALWDIRGQGAGPAVVEAARRRARAGADLCQRAR